MNEFNLRMGVDLVDVVELADMIETSGPTFFEMSWTNGEQKYCDGSVERLAAFWAAKEATMKALGHGLGEVDPLDIETVAHEGYPPSLRLRGAAHHYANEAGLDAFALSLSHDASIAIAYVVAHNQSNRICDPAEAIALAMTTGLVHATDARRTA